MKELFFDLLNGFTPDLLPFFGAIVFTAALTGGLTDWLWARRNGITHNREIAMMSAATACLAYLIKFSIPLSLLAGFLVLAFALRNRSVWGMSHFVALSLSIVMGSGYVIPAVLVWLFLILPLIFLSPRK